MQYGAAALFLLRFLNFLFCIGTSRMVLVVKNPPAKAGDGELDPCVDPLEEEMATHSSILAWRMLWTEEPGGVTVHGVSKSQTQLK